MFAGLASPSHLIVVLGLVLVLFGAKRIPELAKGLGTGIRELREGISNGGAESEAEALEREEAGSGAGSGTRTGTRTGSKGEPVGVRASRGGL